MSSIADLMKFRFQRRGVRNGELQPSPLSTTSQKSEAEPCPSGSTQSDSSGMLLVIFGRVREGSSYLSLHTA